MLFTLLLAALVGFASALPVTFPRAIDSKEAVATELEERDNWSVTRNDLVNGICRPVTVIFARGTVELGNVGTLAGPPFFNALSSMIGDSNIAVQGVDYGASIGGYLEGGDPAGAARAAYLANLAVSQCPGTKIVLSGYSQGAQVIHLGVKQISATVASHVSAAVFFGDPDDGQALQNIAANKEQTYCFSDDLICDGLPIVLPAHLSYALDGPAAASFVASIV